MQDICTSVNLWPFTEVWERPTLLRTPGLFWMYYINNVGVWMVSIFPSITNSSSLFSVPLWAVASGPTTIGITVMFFQLSGNIQVFVNLFTFFYFHSAVTLRYISNFFFFLSFFLSLFIYLFIYLLLLDAKAKYGIIINTFFLIRPIFEKYAINLNFYDQLNYSSTFLLKFSLI